MKRSSLDRRTKILSCFIETSDVEATARITNENADNVRNFVDDVGAACWDFQDRALRGLNCLNIECRGEGDVASSNIVADQPNLRENSHHGETLFWAAIDADTQLIFSWSVCRRNVADVNAFMVDLASRIQPIANGQGDSLGAAENVPVVDIDLSSLIKVYGSPLMGQGRYGTPVFVDAPEKEVIRQPEPEIISTIFSERHGRGVRLLEERYVQPSSAVTWKLRRMNQTVGFHFMCNNFVEINQSSGLTPAIAAGVTDHYWTVEDIVLLTD